MAEDQSQQQETNGKKKGCEHNWGRIWLASRKYQEGKFCTKCLELKNDRKTQKQESR